MKELLTHILNAHVNIITANTSLQTGEQKSHTIYTAPSWDRSKDRNLGHLSPNLMYVSGYEEEQKPVEWLSQWMDAHPNIPNIKRGKIYNFNLHAFEE